MNNTPQLINSPVSQAGGSGNPGSSTDTYIHTILTSKFDDQTLPP